MLINADFSLRAEVPADQRDWVASPQAGVERVMLDRVGGEIARATSIVRYAPDSRFPRHPHPGGEEILVLSGTFSEGDRHYPAGWYMRNPPGTSHAPFSREGAVIFVKLGQMPPSERRTVRIDTQDPTCWQRQGKREVCPLFAADAEQVSLQRLPAGSALLSGPMGGAEVLVLAGSLIEDDGCHESGSWLRLPVGDAPRLMAGPQGVTLYLKTGHLRHVVGA